MEFKQIQTFVALARTLHFGRAAAQLGIAQPHVSRRIKQLEDELDVRLFYRDKRNVRLTEAGDVFLVEARTLLADAETARKRAREGALGRRGKLKLSLISSAMLGALPAVLGEFRDRYPDVHLSFREMGSTLQLDALGSGTTDIAFVHPPVRPPAAFEHMVLEREPLVAVLPRSHPLAGRAQVELADLAREPWIMFPRADSAPIYDRIIALCHQAGFSPAIVQEAGPMHTRLGLVAAGFGVHLVHTAWQTMPYAGVVYIPAHPTATITLASYWRRGDANPMLRCFLEVLDRHRL